jgi:hypothetical protein
MTNKITKSYDEIYGLKKCDGLVRRFFCPMCSCKLLGKKKEMLESPRVCTNKMKKKNNIVVLTKKAYLVKVV